MDDEKPSTRHLVLKPKEIIPVDKVSRPGDGTAITVQLIHRENQLAEAKSPEGKWEGLTGGGVVGDAPTGFRQKEIVPLDPPGGPGDEEAIRVPAILLENRIAEEKSGWGHIRSWKKRKSRRNRDFVLVVGLTDLAIAAYVYMNRDPLTFVYGIAGITLVTSSTAWIMFVVMDDY